MPKIDWMAALGRGPVLAAMVRWPGLALLVALAAPVVAITGIHAGVVFAIWVFAYVPMWIFAWSVYKSRSPERFVVVHDGGRWGGLWHHFPMERADIEETPCCPKCKDSPPLSKDYNTDQWARRFFCACGYAITRDERLFNSGSVRSFVNQKLATYKLVKRGGVDAAP